MKKLLLKTMLLLCALVAGSTSVWADNYTITFSTGSGDGTSASTSTACSTIVSAGSSYLSGNLVTAEKVYYSGDYGLKLGASSNAGTVKMNLASSITPTSIVVSAKLYNSSKNATLKVNGSSTQSVTSTFSNLTYNITSEISYLQLESSKYIWIESITVNYISTPSYTITPTVNDALMGSADISASTITATPNSGYRVKSGDAGYTLSSGTATVTNNGDNTFTVDPSSDCTVQINFEAIPTHTLSSAVSPVGAGSVTFGSATVAEGGTTTATAAANAGYKFTGWSISGTGASLSSTTDNPTTVTMGTADATVTATFEAVKTYAINYSVNGVIVDTKNVEEDADVDFSAPESGVPAGYVFKGWVLEANKIDTPTDSDPSANYVTSATSTADITYYAVMAVSEASEPSLTKMGSSDSFSANDNIVIVAKGTTYAMYQETVNSTYVNNFSFVNNATTIDSDVKNYWTLSAAPTNWYLGDNSNGYLYTSSSNNLASSSEFKTEWTISWNSTQSAFTIIGNSRWLSCRTDLSGGNENKYRMGGTTSNDPSGNAYFDIYKFVPSIEVSKNYCTIVPTATIDINSACTDGDGNYYGTYSNSQAFVVPADLTVSAISVDDSKLTKMNYDTGDIVPANTGVLVAATTSGDHTVNLAAGGTEKSGNMLKASSVAMDMAETEFFRLTMHNGTNVGFWWGAENGAAFSIEANKAYLAVPTANIAGVRGFSLTDEEADGIVTLRNGDNETMRNEVFDLSGRRVVKPTKGLYIVNGKKVVK